MNRARHLIGFSGLLLGTALAGSPVGVFLDAADHLDAPTVRRDGRIDINDIYVFHPGGSPVDPQAAQNLSRTVLIMTVNPAAGLLSDTSFRPDALYEFVLDATGDARADSEVSTRMQPGLSEASRSGKHVSSAILTPISR